MLMAILEYKTSQEEDGVRRNYVKYLCSLLMFGTNGVIASYIALSSMQIVFSRLLLGGLFMCSIALGLATLRRARGAVPRHSIEAPSMRDRVFVLLSGVSMGISWLFQYEAFRTIGVGVTSLVYCIGPVFIVALSPLLFREKIKPVRIAGLGIACLGIGLVNASQGGGALDGYGMMCAILCAAAYVAMVVLNKQAHGLRGVENASLQLVGGLAVAAIACMVRGELPFAIPDGSWIALLLLGLVNSGFGCYLYFSAINALPAQTVALCDYLEPLSAVGWSACWLGESLSPTQLAGAVLIVLGALGSEALTALAKKRAVTAGAAIGGEGSRPASRTEPCALKSAARESASSKSVL